MKRLMYTRLAGVAVTALALTLAGCGGSDNVMEEPPELTAEEKRIMELEEQLENEQAARKEAEDARDTAQGELDAQERAEALATAKALFVGLSQPRAIANGSFRVADSTANQRMTVGAAPDATPPDARAMQVMLPILKRSPDNPMMYTGSARSLRRRSRGAGLLAQGG